jgi:hypothetical protein
MTRRIFGPGLAAGIGVVALTACGPVDVTIIAALGDGADPNASPIGSLEVQLLPYDRDDIFDSLAAAATRPEPEVPADLIAAQTEIAQARASWRASEDRWGVLRDTVEKLYDELEELDRGMRTYQEIYDSWEDLSDELARVERDREGLFETFTGLQEATIGQMDAIRIMRADWADEAFADVGDVIAARMEMAGLDVAVDTTDAGGGVIVRLAPGDYWVHARYELVSEELYWNLPITVVRGEPLEVRLTRANAEVRPVF